MQPELSTEDVFPQDLEDPEGGSWVERVALLHGRLVRQGVPREPAGRAILDIIALGMAVDRGLLTGGPLARAASDLEAGRDPFPDLALACLRLRDAVGNTLFPGGSELGVLAGDALLAVLELVGEGPGPLDAMGVLYSRLCLEIPRKARGIYYTPQAVVRFLVDRTLGATLRDLEGRYLEALSRGDREGFLEAVAGTGRIRVVDPAMGAGAFLSEALSLLLGFFQRLRDMAGASGVAKGAPALEALLSQGPCPMVYGVEIDPFSRDVAALTLALQAGVDPSASSVALGRNLRVGNALTSPAPSREVLALDHGPDLACMVRARVNGAPGTTPGWARQVAGGIEELFSPDASWSQSPRAFPWELEYPEVFFDSRGCVRPGAGFSHVLGNPPWSRLRQLASPSEKAQMAAFFARRYRHQRGNHNLYRLFVELSREIVAPGGRIGLVVPSSFLGEACSLPLRRLLLDAGLEGVVRVPKSQVKKGFEAAPLVEAALVWTGGSERQGVWLAEWGRGGVDLPPDGRVLGEGRAIPRLTLPAERAVLERVSRLPRLGTLGRIRAGEGPFHESAHKEFLSRNPADEPLVRRMRVHRYHLDLKGGSHWRYPMFLRREAFLERKPGAVKLPPVLVGREVLQVGETRRLKFALLDEPLIIGNSVLWLEPGGADPYLLLALLNSAFSEWYFRAFSSTYHVKGYEIVNIPVPPLTRAMARGLSLGARSLEASRGEDLTLDRAMDRSVYLCLGLPEPEVQAIEESLGDSGLGPLPSREEAIATLAWVGEGSG
ncbi:MAG: hypothetical protein AB1576_07435 [Bacillota bacterium]